MGARCSGCGCLGLLLLWGQPAGLHTHPAHTATIGVVVMHTRELLSCFLRVSTHSAPARRGPRRGGGSTACPYCCAGIARTASMHSCTVCMHGNAVSVCAGSPELLRGIAGMLAAATPRAADDDGLGRRVLLGGAKHDRRRHYTCRACLPSPCRQYRCVVLGTSGGRKTGSQPQ